MTPADILTGIAIIVIGGLLGFLTSRWLDRTIAPEPIKPDDCGDQGGMPKSVKCVRPKAPETGSGLHVGGEWD